jgi:hypothetical protein
LLAEVGLALAALASVAAPVLILRAVGRFRLDASPDGDGG